MRASLRSLRGLIAGVVVACAPAATPTIEAPATAEVAEGRSVELAFTATGAVTMAQTGTFAARFGDGDVVVIDAPLGSTGGTLTLTATEGEATVAADVDVVVAPLAYERTTWTDDGPAAREHGALMISDDGATVFLLSGGAYPNFPTQDVIADAWRLDTATSAWSTWDVTGDVPPPAGSRRVGHAAGDVAYLHGGYDGSSAGSDELFRVDLETGVFTRLTQSEVRPSPRALHAFAFDEAHARFVVFGGFFNDGVSQDILDDTWLGALDGDVVTWERLNGAGPPPRYGAFFGVDPGLARFVAVSGAGFPAVGDPIAAYDDVWVLSLDDAPLWTELEPDGEAPRGRRNGCGVVDPVTHGLLVFGGTNNGSTTEPGTWLLDLRDDGVWSHAARDEEPPLRSSAFGAAVPGGGFVCGFGNDAALFQDVFWLR